MSETHEFVAAWLNHTARKKPDGTWGITEQALEGVIKSPTTYAAWVLRSVAEELQQYRRLADNITTESE